MIQYRSIAQPISYSEAHALQMDLVEKRISGLAPDTVVFLEHTPTITRGRGLQWSQGEKPKPEPLPPTLPSNIEYVEVERGGDLTYHGPGQLVIYPIFCLEKRDVEGFLRNLEQVGIDLLASYGLHASRREGATGIWIRDRKIASLGIAVRKWVTYHGLALNVTNDLSSFSWIRPCGFAPEVMTRLVDQLKDPIQGSWRLEMERRLRGLFDDRFQSAFSQAQGSAAGQASIKSQEPSGG